MSRIVPDASVVAAAFFDERHSAAAGELLAGRHEFVCPDLLRVEFGSVVWKRQRAGEITSDEARQLLEDFLALPLAYHSAEQLIGAALEIAMVTDRTVYDCIYVALAVQEDATFVTADSRLANALAKTPLSKVIRKL